MKTHNGVDIYDAYYDINVDDDDDDDAELKQQSNVFCRRERRRLPRVLHMVQYIIIKIINTTLLLTRFSVVAQK